MKNDGLVFVDMDGVVSDFDGHMLDVYGRPMSDFTSQQKTQFWDAGCIAKRFFANSKPIQEGIELVRRLCDAGITISFLTSTGGQLQHVEIAKQKLDFLQRHGLGHLPVAFATGTKCKASFANPQTTLIDDREKVVNAFSERGGTTYLFERSNWARIAESIIA